MVQTIGSNVVQRNVGSKMVHGVLLERTILVQSQKIGFTIIFGMEHLWYKKLI